jgi:hypothetical protein
MAKRKKRAKLTEKGRWRGPAVLDLPVGFDGDGVFDGVQEIMASPMV